MAQRPNSSFRRLFDVLRTSFDDENKIRTFRLNKIMISKIQQNENHDLAWFLGFFVGDGYTTTGRIGVDTISPEAASRIVSILSKLTNKTRIEVYGDPESFSDILSSGFLKYGRRKENHSDYVKIRVDDSVFLRDFVKYKERFIKDIPEHLVCHFLRGFFDAEATVSPQGTIEIDLAKENRKLLHFVGSLLGKLGISYQISEYKSKIRLEIHGRMRRIENLIKFRRTINFSIIQKRDELEKIIHLYSQPRDIRTENEVRDIVFSYLKENSQVEMKSLMRKLNLKYDVLKRTTKLLIKEGKIEKFERNKRKFLKIVS